MFRQAKAPQALGGHALPQPRARRSSASPSSFLAMREAAGPRPIGGQYGKAVGLSAPAGRLLGRVVVKAHIVKLAGKVQQSASEHPLGLAEWGRQEGRIGLPKSEGSNAFGYRSVKLDGPNYSELSTHVNMTQVPRVASWRHNNFEFLLLPCLMPKHPRRILPALAWPVPPPSAWGSIGHTGRITYRANCSSIHIRRDCDDRS